MLYFIILFMNSTEPTMEGGASDLKDKIDAKARELGVQVNFDLPLGNITKTEDVYTETLKFLNNLIPEEIEKLRDIGGFEVKDEQSLDELRKNISAKESGSEVTEKLDFAYQDLYELCDLFGVKLSNNEEHVAQFQDKFHAENPNALAEKVEMIAQVMSHFDGKPLNEKFKEIRLGYPPEESDKKLVIGGDVLYIDLSASRLDVSVFFSVLFPKTGDEVVLEEGKKIENAVPEPSADSEEPKVELEQEIELKPEKDEPKNGGLNGNRHTALAAMEVLKEYGVEGKFRTASFSALNDDQKNPVYEAVKGLPLALAFHQEASDWLKGKLFLVGEPGINYEEGQIRVGTGVSKEEIVEFIKQKAEENKGEISGETEPASEPEQAVGAALEEKPEEKEEEKLENKTEPKSEVIGGINVDTTLYDKSKSTEDYNVRDEIERALYILEDNEREILITNGIKIAIKDGNVLFPVYHEDSKTLDVGFGSDNEDVILAIRNTIIPLIEGTFGQEKKPEPEPEIEVREVKTEVKDDSLPEMQINQMTPPNVAAPAPLVEPAAQQAGPVVEDKKLGLEDLRQGKAIIELRLRKEKREATPQESEILRKYEEERKVRGSEIIDQILAEKKSADANFNPDALSEDEQKKLKAEINNAVFDELVRKECEAYSKEIEANRERTWKDTVKIEAAKVLSNKAVQWYMRQNKWVRFGALTLIAGGIGVLGGGLAVGGVMVGNRLRRGALSFGAAGIANKLGQKKWSIDEVNEYEKKKMEEVEKSNTTLEEKSKAYIEIKEAADKERKRRLRNKAIVTIGAGASAGILSGVYEHLHSDIPIAPSAKLSGPPSPEDLTKLNAKIYAENAPDLPKAPTSGISKIFSDLAALKQTPAQGDSLWSSLGKSFNKGLEQNEQYKALNPIQRESVVSYYTNKGIGDPEKYGLTPDRDYGIRVEVGKPVDFSNLIDDPEELQRVIAKASKLTPLQQTQMKTNDEAILNWLKEHPNTKLTNDKVAEILSTKPTVMPVAPESSSINQEEFSEQV